VSEAPWRRRFRATRLSLPIWARDETNRLVYTSNASGKREIYLWDRATDTHRQATDRPEGTTEGDLDPGGASLWWFDDERGSEFGRWMTQPFAGGPASVAVPALPAAYSAGLALGPISTSSDRRTTRERPSTSSDPPRLLASSIPTARMPRSTASLATSA